MNKQEIISIVAAATGMTKKDTGVTLNATFEAISEALADGNSVKIAGFGKFEIVEKPEKVQNAFGNEVVVPAHNVVKFKPSETLKQKVK